MIKVLVALEKVEFLLKGVREVLAFHQLIKYYSHIITIVIVFYTLDGLGVLY